MRHDINKATICGTLGADAVLRKTREGKAVCNLRIATLEMWNDKETTEWHNVTIWGPQGEALGKLVKGQRVMIEGKMQTRSYEKNGQKIWKTEINASHAAAIVYADRPQEQQARPQNSFGTVKIGAPPAQPDAFGEDENSIPF